MSRALRVSRDLRPVGGSFLFFEDLFENETGLPLSHERQGRLELVAAVAAERAHAVAREALRMETDGHVLLPARIAFDEGGVLLIVTIVPERDDLEVPEARRELGDRGDPNTDPMFAIAVAAMIVPPPGVL